MLFIDRRESEKDMRKLIEIKIEIDGPIDLIRERLRNSLSVFEIPEVSDLSYRNFDYYNGHWTEYSIMRAANRTIRTLSDRIFRKPDAVREDR